MFLAPLGAQAAQHVHPKLLILIAGIVGLSLVWAATLQTDFWYFSILYVVGFGGTNAMTYMVPVHHGWLWFPERPGLVSGIIICGFGFGALIFNNLSRVIVNPENESSDDNGAFSEEVNKRVPQMLQTVLVCFMVMTLVALCLISRGPQPALADQRKAEVDLIDDVVSTSTMQTEQEEASSRYEPSFVGSPSVRGIEANFASAGEEASPASSR